MEALEGGDGGKESDRYPLPPESTADDVILHAVAESTFIEFVLLFEGINDEDDEAAEGGVVRLLIFIAVPLSPLIKE